MAYDYLGKLFIPLGSAIVGAVIAYLFAIKKENRKKILDEKTKAYCDYIRAASKIKFYNRNECLADMVDSIARISVYGSSEVVAALANFKRTTMILDNDIAVEAFVKIVKAMRNETSNMVADQDIKILLFDKIE